MKKYLFLAAALLAGSTLFTSCSEDDDDNVNIKVLTFEGDAFTSLIDNPQYGGILLYGNGEKDEDGNTKEFDYSWTDTDNTLLSSSLTKAWGGLYGYSEGGVAISNYIDEKIKEDDDYLHQLAVPVANGSSNFAVVYCDASIAFSDSVARVIRGMQVAPTTYELGVITYGNDWGASSLAEEGELTVDIEGLNGKASTGHVKVDMAKDGKLLTTWTNVDLTSLGKVTELKFTMTGTDYSDKTKKDPSAILSPKYFAFDNVVVEFEK